MLRRASLLLVTSLVLVGGVSRTARACSCLPPPPPADALERADVVFEGRPYAASTDGSRIRFSFEVDRFWKGEPGERVDVETASSSAACGRSFQIGTAYVVYARQSGEEMLSDSLCSRSRTTMAAEDDLEVLGAGQRPGDEPPSPAGEADAPPREPPRIATADAAGPPAALKGKRGCAVEMPHTRPGPVALIALVLGVAIGRRRAVRSGRRPPTQGAR